MLRTAPGTCTLGLLDYKRLNKEVAPVVDKARGGGSPAEVVNEMRAVIARIDEQEDRDNALAQLERIDHALQSGRWQYSAAGIVLECTCVEDPVLIDNRFEEFQRYCEFLFQWNEAHAATLLHFFGYLSDHTLRWATSGDAWRAALPPRTLIEPSEAMNAMTRREFRKMLIAIEDGGVFSEADADNLSRWWDTVRKAMRMAVRLEKGLFLRTVSED